MKWTLYGVEEAPDVGVKSWDLNATVVLSQDTCVEGSLMWQEEASEMYQVQTEHSLLVGGDVRVFADLSWMGRISHVHELQVWYNFLYIASWYRYTTASSSGGGMCTIVWGLRTVRRGCERRRRRTYAGRRDAKHLRDGAEFGGGRLDFAVQTVDCQ